MRKAHCWSALAVRLKLLSIGFLLTGALIQAMAPCATAQVQAAQAPAVQAPTTQAQTPQAQAAQEPGASAKSALLPVEVVVDNLLRRNALRAVALTQFEGTRTYRLQYRGFPSDHDAEMVVHVTYHAPSSKRFTVVSQTGSKFVGDHVFKKLLEGELEAANEENRRRSALSRENYDFTLAGYESSHDGGSYILDLLPKTKNKFLYRGKIWVDAKDFAVMRIEGEPGKSPSFWIKKTDIVHRYVKVDDFWLPAENRSESVLRMGGRAILSIEYRDYKILEASHLNQPEPALSLATVKSR
jgi:hypothetical protein